MAADLPLMEALQAGNESALNELINRHCEPLGHFVYRHLHDEAAARDVVQETFVRLFFKAKKFEPRSSVKTWIYAIALNLARDHGRKFAKRRREVSLNAAGPDDRPPMEIADTGPTPGEEAGQRDRFSALQRAIDKLAHKLKAAPFFFPSKVVHNAKRRTFSARPRKRSRRACITRRKNCASCSTERREQRRPPPGSQ